MNREATAWYRFIPGSGPRRAFERHEECDDGVEGNICPKYSMNQDMERTATVNHEDGDVLKQDRHLHKDDDGTVDGRLHN